ICRPWRSRTRVSSGTPSSRGGGGSSLKAAAACFAVSPAPLTSGRVMPATSAPPAAPHRPSLAAALSSREVTRYEVRPRVRDQPSGGRRSTEPSASGGRALAGGGYPGPSGEPLDLQPQRGELLERPVVAALDVVHPAQGRGAVGHRGGEHRGEAG